MDGDFQVFAQAAEAADALAAEKVSAFRPRHELLTLRQQWDDLAKTNTDLPTLNAAVIDAATAYGEAQQATEDTEQHTERLRVAAERAADTADQELPRRDRAQLTRPQDVTVSGPQGKGTVKAVRVPWHHREPGPVRTCRRQRAS